MQKEADGFLANLMKWDALLGQRVLDTISFFVPAFLFSAYALAPKASDLQNDLVQFVVLLVFFIGSLWRLVASWNRLRSLRFQTASAFFDIACLYTFLLIIPLAYNSPAAISLKAPTANLLFVFIIARIVLFDVRLIVTTGLSAAAGWFGLTAWSIFGPSSTDITNQFLEYTTSNKVLIGAQVEHVITILLVTLVSAAVVNAYQRDGLTGLRKQREFLKGFRYRLKQRSKTGPTALILVRVSNWHELARANKAQADKSLQMIASALLRAPVPTEMSARYDADAIMLWKRCAEEDTALLNHLRLLQQSASDALPHQRALIQIGAVRIEGDADEAVQNVLAASEKAFDQADKIQICDSNFMAWMQEQSLLQDRVQKSVDNDWLVVHHQPIVDMLSNQIVGTEALLRLKAEDGSFVSPARFIPIAERTGAIEEIGAHVLRTASEDNLSMREAGLCDDLFVSVNVAPPQIYEWSRLNDAVAVTLKHRTNLKLEITESQAAQDESMHQRLLQLRAQGAKLAIDDFGTGYSSLERLGDLPFDTVKIDLAFTRKITSQAGYAMIDAIVRMAKASGKDVIIEGIETAEQHSLAIKAGIRFGQGYYFGRPASVDDILKDVKSQPVETNHQKFAT